MLEKEKNDDVSSQRGMTVFLAGSRERSSRDGMTYRNQIDYQSQKIEKTAFPPSALCSKMHHLWVNTTAENAITDLAEGGDQSCVPLNKRDLHPEKNFSWNMALDIFFCRVVV